MEFEHTAAILNVEIARVERMINELMDSGKSTGSPEYKRLVNIAAKLSEAHNAIWQ